MSASIYWEPVKDTHHRTVGVSAPSSFIEAMRRAFGEYPWILSGDALQTLGGMAAAYGGDADNPYTKLADIICRNGKQITIKVWPEY